MDGDKLGEVPGRIEPEPVASRERDQQDKRAQEAQGEHRCTQPERTRLHLRQPEPGVQGGQDEDQRVRVGGDDHEPDDAECKQRRGMARELVVNSDGTARGETCARDRPAGGRKRGESEQPERRPVARGCAVRCERKCGSAGPNAGEGEKLEDDSDPEPEHEPASVAA